MRAIGTNCAHPGGATVTATVNGAPLSLTPRGDGLYTGVYTPTQTGALTVEVYAAVGALSKSATVSGSAVENYVPSDGPYAWVDATAGGTKLTLGDDEAASVPIPFPFTFYGASFSSVKVSSNAMLVFGADPATAYDNKPLPDPMTPNRILAPLWDDLNPLNGGGIWYRTVGSAPNRRFVVAWVGVPHYLAVGHKVTLEAILEEGTNGIVFQYQDMSSGDPTLDYGADASVGMEDAAGAIGRQFLYKDSLLSAYEGCQEPSLHVERGRRRPPLRRRPPTAASNRTPPPPPPLHRHASTVHRLRPTASAAATPPPCTSRGATRSSPAASTRVSARCRDSSPMTGRGSRSAPASGGTKVSSFYASATIAAGHLATLRRLQVDYNGNATGSNTNVSLRVWNWSTSTWVTIDGPVRGATTDRSATWSTASPAAYVSPGGEVRVNVRGTRSSSFRLRTDLIRFTIDY